jgi:hypothetical protein
MFLAEFLKEKLLGYARVPILNAPRHNTFGWRPNSGKSVVPANQNVQLVNAAILVQSKSFPGFHEEKCASAIQLKHLSFELN